jgi:biopolymer transport protein ExbD
MKLNKGRRGGKLEINMTPMIDVTFLLLIFFMTVNQISNTNAEPVELPQLKGSQDQSEAVITVNVDQLGDIIVSGNRLSLGQFASLVGTELAANESDPTRIRVVLRADRRGTSRVVNEIVAMLVRLDIRQVRIAVRSGEE